MTMKCKKNYYDILGVTPDSDNDEVKSSYRKLARKYHPDVNKDFGSAELFKDVLEAYEILSDDKKRKNYDMINGFYKTPKDSYTSNSQNFNSFSDENKSEDKKNTSPSDEFKKASKNTFSNSSNQNNNDNNKKHKDKNYNHDNYSAKFFKDRINSILDDIVKSHFDRTARHEPKNGEDISTQIEISLSESITGTERVLNIMHKEICPHCRGRKFINSAKCPKCDGQGIYEEKRKITVKIPKGVKNKTKLRLIGEGNPGFYGGHNGNLYIDIIVIQDKNTTYDGNNILYTLPITPYEAVLGGEIDIPTCEGIIKFVLPSLTSSGQQFRIAQKGLKTNNNFGDMIITVEIQLPKELSDDEINLYEKLKKLSKTNIRENY